MKTTNYVHVTVVLLAAIAMKLSYLNLSVGKADPVEESEPAPVEEPIVEAEPAPVEESEPAPVEEPIVEAEPAPVEESEPAPVEEPDSRS